MSDVDETLFGNNNYRETCDMSKYSGCRGQRFALREHIYTSRVIHTLVCRSVIVDSQSLHCTYTYLYTRRLRAHETASGPSEAGKRNEAKETKGGNAVQPLTELDGFEKSWESAVACSRIALEHQTRKERLAEKRWCAYVRRGIWNHYGISRRKSGYIENTSVISKTTIYIRLLKISY